MTTCQQCGARFEIKRYGPRRGVLYCSRRCKDRACAFRRTGTFRREPYERLPKTERSCLRCGESYIGTQGRRFCSALCGQRYHGQLDRDRRRALERAAKAEPINRLAIYERDGWICGVCGLTVDRTFRATEPLGPTLDHVVAIAKGGAHVAANVQLAHRICNNRKSARVAA